MRVQGSHQEENQTSQAEIRGLAGDGQQVGKVLTEGSLQGLELAGGSIFTSGCSEPDQAL